MFMKRSARWAAAVTVMAALAACSGGNSHPAAIKAGGDPSLGGGDPSFGGGDPASSPPAAHVGSGNDPIRFVIVLPPDHAPVDIRAGVDGNGDAVATGLHPGAVTDYLPVGPDGLSVVDAGGKVLTKTGGTAPDGRRFTMIVGTDKDGAVVSEYIAEANGRWYVDDGTGKAIPPAADEVGKARLITDGDGLGAIAGATGSSVRLGTAARHCVAAEGDTGDPNEGGFGVAAATSPFDFPIAPGATDLVWLTDVDCRTVESAALHVTLEADRDAYLLPWFKAADRLHMLYVPITKDGAGDKGVVDSADGPTFAAENFNTVIDSGSASSTSSLDAVDSSAGESSTTDDTSSDSTESEVNS